MESVIGLTLPAALQTLLSLYQTFYLSLELAIASLQFLCCAS
jgi:hypothetical protein